MPYNSPVLWGMNTSRTAPPIIRAATPADTPAMGRLGALLVHTHHELDAKRFMAPSSETERGYASFLGSQLGRTSVILLVAELDDEVIAYSYSEIQGLDYMSLRGPAGVVHDIVVDGQHRGCGVGQRLLDATLAAMTARGVPQIVLSAATRNEPARRLFARAGFRETMVEMTRG